LTEEVFLEEQQLRFSKWFGTTRELIVMSPTHPCILQFKLLGRLLDYPNGKSAMVYYGTGNTCRELLEAVLPQLQERFADQELVWRYKLQAQPAPGCQILIQRFEKRFGGPPVANRQE